MKQIIGIADMKVSNTPSDILITYALGSCLGITVYDSVAKVGGMLHIMLPLSTNNAAKAAENPLMFVDTGVPQLFKACYNLGAKKERLILKVAGGASLRQNQQEDQFQIGKRNIVMLKKLLWKNNVIIHSEHVGENYSRTMAMNIADGEVTLKINNQDIVL
jgi:chemotaxis protein CheD